MAKRRDFLVNMGRFSRACQAIHHAMKHDVPMTEAEQLKLENNLVLIQMGYLQWKHRNPSGTVDVLRRGTRESNFPVSNTLFVNEPLAVLVVDDFAPCRDAIRHIFDEFIFVNIVGEARDGHSAIEMACRLVPQIILMDVSMPRLGGAEATRQIKRMLPDVHVIGVSSQDDTATRDAMNAAGCSAFVAKECAHTLPSIIAILTGRQAKTATS